jgi:hypothetical protein
LHATVRALYGARDHRAMLFVRQRRTLSRRPARHDSLHASFDLSLDEGIKRAPIDGLSFIVTKRRD